MISGSRAPTREPRSENRGQTSPNVLLVRASGGRPLWLVLCLGLMLLGCCGSGFPVLGSQFWVSVFSPTVRAFWATSQKPITSDLRPRASRSSSRVGGTSSHKRRAPSQEPEHFVRYPQECGQLRQPLQRHHWRCVSLAFFSLFFVLAVRIVSLSETFHGSRLCWYLNPQVHVYTEVPFPFRLVPSVSFCVPCTAEQAPPP